MLLYNYAGQAGTAFRNDESLDADAHAAQLLELIHHVDSRGELALSHAPYHLVGCGYGLAVAARLAFTLQNTQLAPRALVSVNGLARCDAQFAAILQKRQRLFVTSHTYTRVRIRTF